MIIIISVGTDEQTTERASERRLRRTKKRLKLITIFSERTEFRERTRAVPKKQKAKEGSIIAGHFKTEAKITRDCMITQDLSLVYSKRRKQCEAAIESLSKVCSRAN